MHSILLLINYFCYVKSWEVLINLIYDCKHFAKCSNTTCNRTFFCSPSDFEGEEDLLCPRCKNKMDSHHIVQCLNCGSIVDFIEAEPSEEPVVFTVERCSHCHGTTADERLLTAYFYPDAFI